MFRKISQEHSEQIAALDWFKLQYPKEEKWSFHIANERKCTPIYGKFLQKLGVKKGISDLFIPEPRGRYHGLWIEIKSKSGRKTKEQIEFIDAMNAKGYFAVFCFGADEIINTIKFYLSLT